MVFTDKNIYLLLQGHVDFTYFLSALKRNVCDDSESVKKLMIIVSIHFFVRNTGSRWLVAAAATRIGVSDG